MQPSQSNLSLAPPQSWQMPMDEQEGDGTLVTVMTERRLVARQRSPLRGTHPMQTTSLSPPKEHLKEQVQYLLARMAIVKSEAEAWASSVRTRAEGEIYAEKGRFENEARHFEDAAAAETARKLAMQNQRALNTEIELNSEMQRLKDKLQIKTEQASSLQGAVVTTERQAEHHFHSSEQYVQSQNAALQRASIEVQQQQAQLAAMQGQLQEQLSLASSAQQAKTEIEQEAMSQVQSVQQHAVATSESQQQKDVECMQL